MIYKDIIYSSSFNTVEEDIKNTLDTQLRNSIMVFKNVYPRKERINLVDDIYIEIVSSGLSTPYVLNTACQDYASYCLLKHGQEQGYPNITFIKFPTNWLREGLYRENWKDVVNTEVKKIPAKIVGTNALGGNGYPKYREKVLPPNYNQINTRPDYLKDVNNEHI